MERRRAKTVQNGFLFICQIVPTVEKTRSECTMRASNWCMRSLIAFLATALVVIMTHCNIVWLPKACLFETLFGIPCPACGITRSVFALAHLDFALSWHFCPLCIPILLCILSYPVFFTLSFAVRPVAGLRLKTKLRIVNMFDVSCTLLLASNWLYQLSSKWRRAYGTSYMS